MTDKTWKRRERQLAIAFGSTRTGPTGRDDVDFQHPYLLPEVKSRKTLPKWALDCLAQSRAARSAGTGGKIPVAFLVGAGMRWKDGLAVMRVQDLLDICGRVVVQDASE